MMERKYNDHRDFYGLAALLEAGYIGFTGPIYNTTYQQIRLFQAYSQGGGNQTYDGITLFSDNLDSYFYVAPKSLDYFHNRKEQRMGWYLTAALALIASIISGVAVSQLTTTQQVNCQMTTK